MHQSINIHVAWRISLIHRYFTSELKPLISSSSTGREKSFCHSDTE